MKFFRFCKRLDHSVNEEVYDWPECESVGLELGV